jgi:hypothetical protein
MVTQIEACNARRFAFNPVRVPSTTVSTRVKRWERIDGKTVARRGKPIQSFYTIQSRVRVSFYSDMSRRPSKVNNEEMLC